MTKKHVESEHINADGQTPDMRYKENRDDPAKIAEANERQQAANEVACSRISKTKGLQKI